MKKILFLLPFIVLLFAACNKDEDTQLLNYDGSNFSAPALPQGIHEAAVRFTPNETDALIGQKLTSVQVYFVSVPTSTEIIIYGEGTANTPGTERYRADVSTEMTVDSWNTHDLNTPVEITGEDLWIAVRVDHPEEFGSVGCDTGPAATNGDLMLPGNATDWTDLRTFTNQEVDINWNIRGILEAE